MGSSAFISGFNAEREVRADRRQRKQALSDEERQFKVSDLYTQGHELAQLIPSLNGERREQAMKALTDVEQSIAQIYHPDNNPGAIQKDWNMLVGLVTRKPRPIPLNVSYDSTVTPALTLPAEGGMASGAPVTIPGRTVDVRPAQETMTPQQRQTMARRDDARKKAEIDVEAAGLSPEEETQGRQQLDEAHLAWQLDWAKRHGIEGEALDELTQHLAGVPTLKSKLKPLAGSKPYKGNDGRYYQSMQDQQTGQIEAEAMPEGYTPPPPTSGPIRAWKKNPKGQIVSVLLDRATNAPIAGTENSDILPPPYLTLRISQDNYHFIDEDNQIHSLPETRTSGPALGGRAPSGGGRASGGTSSGAPSAAAARPRAASGDRVIGVKGSAALNKARSSYGDAVKLKTLADSLVKNPNSEKDALFVLALIRSEAGRVNQKEIDSVFQAGGISEGPARWAAKVGHGELSATLRSWLQGFASDQVTAAQAVVDELRAPGKAKGNEDVSDDEFLQEVK